MALPLIYLVGAGVAVLIANRKKKLSGDPPIFNEPPNNPLVLSGTGVTRGGLNIASQLQRDRFIKGQGSSPVTPPPSLVASGGSGLGKPPGFR